MDTDPTGTLKGAKIRALRIERGISMRDFAYHIGTERQALSNIELGNKQVSVKRLVTIADILRVPLDELVHRAGDKDEHAGDVAA